MTPFIEVATKLGEASKISPHSPLARIGSELQSAIGSHIFFLDFHADMGVRLMNHVLDQCAAAALSPIPVLTHDRIQRAALLRRKPGFERGVCFRVPLGGRIYRTGQSISQQLDELLEATSLKPERADLVLDLGLIGQQPGFGVSHIQRTVEEIEDLPAWRSIALAGTVIPPSLTGYVEPDTVGTLDRLEWRYWHGSRSLPLPRQLSFADYAVQSPERPDGGRGGWGNIRYTGETEVIIARGHRVSAHDYAQYTELARKIRQHASFRGPGFSWGDDEIATYAAGAVPPLWAEHWRAFGTSHHLELVTRALAAMESAA